MRSKAKIQNDNEKLKIILVAMIFFFGSFGCSSADNSVSQTGTGPLRVLSTNPRYFTDGSGKAVYLTGSHTWSNLVEEPGINTFFDYQGYLNFLITNNHNFIRLWSWQAQFEEGGVIRVLPDVPLPWPRTGPGPAVDGKLKFDLTKFDQSYFDRLRSRVIAARDKGIYVSIMLYEGWCLAGEEIGKERECWTWHPFNINNNVNGINADANGDGKGYEFYKSSVPSAVKDLQKAYIRKVVDTVNDLDNVLYEIVNEAAPTSVGWQYEMINYLKSCEATKPKQHPVGMTFPYFDTTNAEVFNGPADWVSPGYLTTEDYRGDPPVASGSKVILLDTDHLWGIGGDRVWIWKSFTRGMNPIFMDLMELASDTDATRQAARRNMGYTLAYANRMNLAAMTPSSSSSNCSTTYCLRNPGNEYLVYQPNSGSFRVDLQSGNYSYEWFNPVAGTVASSGAINQSMSGNRSFTPPFSNDAVLYLKAVISSH
jgi:hypothetical protein